METETSSSGKDVKIIWLNVNKFMNDMPVIYMSSDLCVPKWFHKIAAFLFTK